MNVVKATHGWRSLIASRAGLSNRVLQDPPQFDCQQNYASEPQ
jgi:hypothetical protein